MSRRTLQIASTIERAVAEILARGLNDPRMKGMPTITSVDVKEDLSVATIAVTILPEESESVTLHALRAASGYIRRRAMKQVHLREMPRIEFVLDTGLKNQARVLELLNRAAQERAQRSGEDREGEDAQEDGHGENLA